MNNGTSDGSDLKARTKAYALRIIRLVQAMPHDRTTDIIGKQLLRAGTSVGANYRAARRARSESDFIAKLKIVEEEADESLYWLELLAESGLVPRERLADLSTEGNALLAIIVKSINTARDSKLTSRIGEG